MQPLKPSTVKAALRIALADLRPVLLIGPPGVGKSRIIQELAREYAGVDGQVPTEMYLRDQRLSTMDPVDLRGLPRLTDDGRTEWSTPAYWPTDDDVKAGRACARGVVFYDEITAAPMSMQSGVYQNVLDRCSASGAHLAREWAMLAAGNDVKDGAAAQRTSSALNNRFLHLSMEPDLDDWCAWALESGRIPPVMVAFLRYRPNLLHQHSATQRAYPTPRSWEFAAGLIERGASKQVEHALICGAVGEGAATEFGAFLDLYRRLPSIDGIIMDPQTAPVPDDPSTRYAVTFAVAHRATTGNWSQVIAYLERLPEEYNVLGVKYATGRDQKLTQTYEFTTWVVKHAGVFS